MITGILQNPIALASGQRLGLWTHLGTFFCRIRSAESAEPDRRFGWCAGSCRLSEQRTLSAGTKCKAMQSDAKRCKAICLVLVADVWLCVFAHRISHNATCTEESSLVLHGLPLRGKQRACGSTWGWSCSRYKGQGLPKQPQELKNVGDSG